ncbi:hypothetical protein Bcav_3606 [Beutenbergia cavernae DSM 12333]|uniref:Uncharacterized protein n=1 Tax=Beutenbergia cavernae (strain ATCC BAA-8 / DSM 12333 / CCUG 43141 / JCM 11478 / NBRC 16432 / NCIMB 13614 / HKI 0122) TaxID=471853 RepID=C5C304_BEUC1|nr:hypothetical protein [Beutenbergia cavernae]ACQ81848.1 hypothetical protein Bcav_3606 [Beutenbergia cavernae DSM 12333]
MTTPTPPGPSPVPPAGREAGQPGRGAAAWLGYAVGLVALGVLAVATFVQSLRSVIACSRPPELAPATWYCGSDVATALLPLVPILAFLGYVVAGAVSVVVLRRSTASVVVPLVLAVLAAVVLIAQLLLL